MNAAWLLAAAGRSVLVLDWSTDRASASRFVQPFEVAAPSMADALGSDFAAHYTAALGPLFSFDDVPRLRRFALPGGTRHIDVVEMTTSNSTPIHRDPVPGATARLRDLLRDSPYDDILAFTLIRNRDEFVDTVGRLSDTAAICFEHAARTTTIAVETAEALRQCAPAGIGILPVLTPADAGLPSNAGAVRAGFHELLAAPNGILPPETVIELPAERSWTGDRSQPVLTYGPSGDILGVLAEPPTGPWPVTAAYEELISAISGGRTTGAPPIDTVIRARYRQGVGLQTERTDHFLVVSAPVDQPWAEWAGGQLRQTGAQVTYAHNDQDLTRLRLDGLVLVSSEALDESLRTNVLTPVGRGSLSATRLRVDRGGRPTAPGDHTIDVPVPDVDEPVERREKSVRAQLLTYFGLIAGQGTDPTASCRFPLAEPELRHLPTRPRVLLDREPQMAELREKLLEARGLRPVFVGGQPGSGKSALAAEYAHRFAFDYDVVWWFSPHNRQATLAQIFQLNNRLRANKIVTDAAGTALDVLAGGDGFGRWLLVYDDVADLALINDLIRPNTARDIIVTTVDATTGDGATLGLGRLAPQTTVDLLTSRINDLSPTAALAVGEAAGRVPLALNLAAACLAMSIEAIRQDGATLGAATSLATEQFTRRIAAERTASPDADVVAHVLAALTEILQHTPEGRLAVLLGQLCSFLFPESIGLDLIRSRPMLDMVVRLGGADAKPLRLDAGIIDRVLWIGARAGVFHVTWAENASLRMHRLVQARLRERMSAEDREQRRDQMLAVLADYAPNEVELEGGHARFMELQKHIEPSEAMYSHHDLVRRWLVNHLQFLYRTGDTDIRRAVVDPATQTLKRWEAAFGNGDELYVRMAAQLANIHRALGHNDEALRLDEAALMGPRRSPRPHHEPSLLIAARGRGADLRGLGRFKEAQAEDQAIWQALKDVLGEDHPHTRKAANNLAEAKHLAGDLDGALPSKRTTSSAANDCLAAITSKRSGPSAIWASTSVSWVGTRKPPRC